MNHDGFGKDLATGSYDLIALDILNERPAYAYEIIRKIFEQSRHTIRWREGTVYRVLHHLEELGYATSRWREPQRGRQRRYYTLTARGRRIYKQQRVQWRAFSTAVNALLGF